MWRGGGRVLIKGGTWMLGGQDPLSTSLPTLLKTLVAASFSSLRPYFDQKLPILAPTREISQNSSAYIWLNFQFTSLQNI